MTVNSVPSDLVPSDLVPSNVVPTPVGVHSYKLRNGRITSGQRAALEQLMPTWGVPTGEHRIDLPTTFGRRAPVVLEVGFGMGETTLAMAAADPGRDLLAVDVHTPGAGALLRDAAAAGLTNIRVVIGDVLPVLRDMIDVGTLDEIRVYFPDPWPKLRHHKRRLVTASFVHLAATRLRAATQLDAGGRLHLATDWSDYAQRMLAAVSAEPLLHNGSGGFAPRPAHRPVTRFERQGLARDHRIFDVLAVRTEVPAEPNRAVAGRPDLTEPYRTASRPDR
jgi:tRNA (guanine-N7-)-methyltransferase